MRFLRLRVLVVLTLAVWVGSACDASGSPAGASPAASPVASPASSTPSPSPLASANGKLAAEVPMPNGFPTDLPIYPGSRLTSAGESASNGSTNWTMEWQTLDRVSKIQSFFIGRLDSGDWVLLAYSGTVDISFAATFNRNSNAKVKGSLKVAISGGVTKISLTLTTVP